VVIIITMPGHFPAASITGPVSLRIF